MVKRSSLLLTIVILLIFGGCTQKQEKLSVPSSTPEDEIFQSSINERIPVIFSHGGGPCDIGALVFLTKNPHVQLIGMVLSFGEIHPINALEKWPTFLYDVLDYENAALGLGSETPMDPNGHEFPAEWRTLADDFWGLELPPPGSDPEPVVGYQLIIDLINASPEKVTLLVMGAQTDIAMALMHDPGIADNIANIVIMGGAFTTAGNIYEGIPNTTNEAAEWNMYVDPMAADYVLHSGVPVSIVPLDAIQYIVPSDDLAEMNSIDDPGVAYVSQMWNKQWEWSNGNGFLIWDTITATAVTNPENFQWIYDGVDVITQPGDFQGQTVPLNNHAQNVRYAVSADYQAIMNLIFDIFSGEVNAAGQEIHITELAGTWEGYTGNFHITFYLDPDCVLNQKCGTFEISEFSLTGDVAIVNIIGDTYEFKATNISSGQPGNEYEYLQLLGDGTLKYHTEGSGTINEAVLHKK